MNNARVIIVISAERWIRNADVAKQRVSESETPTDTQTANASELLFLCC